MEKMINYGIDLGTTNSAIAKFVKGDVEVFRNPLEAGRETLPSVVYYKSDKIIVGSRARTYLERDAKNVFSTFKRKMGTTESFKVQSINQSKTPVELSAEILKELKGFVHTGEQVDAAIITVPASFELPQITATKEAGYLAGFKQVLTLPEPIAASLAYANKRKEKDLVNGQWLVYDLGGGTFDVALIKIKDGEMKVLDHEGDNFLGGADFDNLIVEKFVVPFMNKNYKFNNLENELKSESLNPKRNALYYRLLYLSEQAKISLSGKTSAEIPLENISDDSNEELNTSMDITRSEFESLIKEFVDKTIEMIKKILVRNSLKPSDIQFTLMVGGSTYIPYVRKRVEEILQIPVNCDIEPITAIVIGAARYAGTKEKNFEQEKSKKVVSGIKVRLAYPRVSQEEIEILAGRIDGNIEGLFYQIIRDDKGYDSGRKKLTTRISEDLPLVKDSYNSFRFIVLDGHSNTVDTDAELIGISQGIDVVGTPISHDICLEVDNPQSVDNSTKLELCFQKGSILPLRFKKTYTLHKTILKGTEDKIRIHVLEGSQTSIPEALNTIGYFEINGKQISRDILRGTEIEIKVEMSENHDVRISAYLHMSDQEFNMPYTGQDRPTTVEKLKTDVEFLSDRIEKEIEQSVEREDYEVADQLTILKKQMNELKENVNTLQSDDVTDKKFQHEDKKRKYAQAFFEITKDKQMALLKVKYSEDKEWCKQILDKNGNDHDFKIFNEVVEREKAFLNSITPLKIMEAIDELINLGSNILWRTPSFLEAKFKRLIENTQRFNDQEQAKSFIEAGHLAITNKNFDRLREINFGLISLLPKSAQEEEKSGKIGF